MDKNSIYKRAIKKWGEDAQMVVAVEECGELIQAVTKQLRTLDNLENLSEEIADVQIMLDQLIFMLDNKEKVDDYINYKLKRLESIL